MSAAARSIRLAICSFFLLFLLSVPASGENGNAPSSSLEADFSSLLTLIREQSPGLYEQLQTMPREQLLQQILDTMKSGVRLSPNEETSSRPASAEPGVPMWPGRLLERRQILYLRLDRMTEDSWDTAQNEVFASLYAKPVGLILDLRAASGSDPEAFLLVPQFVSLFLECPAPVKLRTEYYRTRPLVVLTDRTTSGAPAQLAACLAQGKRTMTMGLAPEGSLFPLTSIPYGERYTLSVPQVPEHSSLPSLSPNPMFRVASRQIAYPDFGKPDAISRDRALRSALDFLLAVSALEEE